MIALMMEAAGTSETSVNFYQTTQRNIAEDSHPDLIDFLILTIHEESCNPYPFYTLCNKSHAPKIVEVRNWK
jgi:hypothetical protein